MLCPVCRVDNYEGEDNCGNCGADLRTSDIPQPPGEYADSVLGDGLAALALRRPVIVEPSLPVAEAVARMQREGVDCLLVCEADRLVGIFTDRDAVVKVAGRPLDGSVISELMTPDPVVLRHDDSVAVAIHKMAVGGFRHIPIIDGDRPIGVVAAADIFRHLTAELP